MFILKISKLADRIAQICIICEKKLVVLQAKSCSY